MKKTNYDLEMQEGEIYQIYPPTAFKMYVYDNLPSYVSFIQAGSITENPHIIYDLMGEEVKNFQA